MKMMRVQVPLNRLITPDASHSYLLSSNVIVFLAV